MTRFMLALVVTVLIVVPAVTAKWRVDETSRAPLPPQLGRVVVVQLQDATASVLR